MKDIKINAQHILCDHFIRTRNGKIWKYFPFKQMEVKKILKYNMEMSFFFVDCKQLKFIDFLRFSIN